MGRSQAPKQKLISEKMGPHGPKGKEGKTGPEVDAAAAAAHAAIGWLTPSAGVEHFLR